MKNNYTCSQRDLYTALRILWNCYLQFWTFFKDYKDYYTEDYATMAKAAVQAAEDLPDHSVNLGASGVKRIEMKKQAKIVCADFLKTKGYINTAFKNKKERKINFVQAGSENYIQAIKGNWKRVEALGKCNKIYVAKNATKLKENQNMPIGFPTTVRLHYTSFSGKFQAYMSAKDMNVKTADKVKANNDCFDMAKDMMFDAKTIFKNDKDKAKLFLWNNILKLVSLKQAGLQGKIKDKATKVMLPGVVVELQLEEEPTFEVVTDEEGKYSAKGITAGKYCYIIRCVGKKSIVGEKEVKTGTVSRMNFEMEEE